MLIEGSPADGAAALAPGAVAPAKLDSEVGAAAFVAGARGPATGAVCCPAAGAVLS